MRIVLLGNYAPDNQHSMRGFCQATKEGLTQQGHSVEVWEPKAVFGRFFSSPYHGMGKWVGYIDKYMLFPVAIMLKRALQPGKDKQTSYHVCDHSNSMYLNYLPKSRTMITCHDVLAIQGSIGMENTYVASSKTGKIFQALIRKNLVNARYVVSISHYTHKQLVSLASPSSDTNNWNVIHNMYKNECGVLDPLTIRQRLAHLGDLTATPFIMHVGSDLARKNRKVLIEVMSKIKDKWPGNLIFVGSGPSRQALDRIKELGLSSRVYFVENPPTEVVVALYNICFAVMFPSYSEGFGLPLIEAQACGAPVIASDIEPLLEVSNQSAVHVDPDDVDGFSEAILSFKNPEIRNDIIRKGNVNARNFQPVNVTKSYLKVHHQMRESTSI